MTTCGKTGFDDCWRAVSFLVSCAALLVSAEAWAKPSVFFVGAHPDDSEGFGATAFLMRDKYDLHVIDLTRGELGLGEKGLKDGSTGRRRTAEEEACRYLGATPHFLSEVDGNANAGEKSVMQLTELLKAHKPVAVFTHWPVDTHPDHVQASAVVAHAIARAGVKPERYFFEVEIRQTSNYRPLYTVDVTSTIENKLEMLRKYVCQNGDDFLAKDNLKRALMRGKECGFEYAETFTTYDGKPIAGGVLEALPHKMTKGFATQPREGDEVWSQDRKVYVHAPNYDEGKIPAYTLEDPLTFLDGRRVTKENWPERRREILGIFAREMYGAEPPAPETVETELVDVKTNAIAGFAIRRQYKMWFRRDKTGPRINWIVWLPRHAKGPVPVVSFLNYNGNAELVSDADIPLLTAYSRGPDGDSARATPAYFESIRGRQLNPDHRTHLPIQTIIARGYAVMSACYCDVSPDPEGNEKDPRHRQNPFAYTGVFELWGSRDPSRTDNTTALGAWAWALSRGLDLAERIPEIDAKRAVVTGSSRLGKAALIAAARDERFAVCVPNQTGGGGVPLAKRDFGENVSTENRMFTHWYCTAYAKYAKEPHRTLTFDQHLLLACIAPRALLVEGFNQPWFDTKGEFLAVKAASPVWELLTGAGLPTADWPDAYDTSAIGRTLGYVRRTEDHGLSAVDWNWLLNFADRTLTPCDSTGSSTVGRAGDD